MLAKNYLWISSLNILYKRDFIGNERFDESFIVGEEVTFFLHLFAKEPKVYLETDFVSYAVRTVGPSTTRNLTLEKIKASIRGQEARKEAVESYFPELRPELAVCLFRERTKSLISLSVIGGKEAKAEYKRLRKEYLSLGKMKQKNQFSKKERILDLMIRLNVLWRVYRIKS